MNSQLNLNRTLKILWSSGPKWAIANVVLLVIQGVIPVIALYVMKLIIDAVTAGVDSPEKAAAFGQVKLLIGLAIIVAILGIAVEAASKVVKDAQAQLMSDRIYNMLHAKSIEVDLEYYDNSDYYDTLHQAQSQSVYRPFKIMMELMGVAQQAISLTAIIGLLISLHWGIALILFATALPGIFVRLKLSNRQYRWMQRRTSTERQANYMSQLLTQDAHAKEIRLFALGDYFQRQFRSLRQQIRREKIDLMTSRSIQEAGIQIGSTLAVFGSFAFISYRTIQGQITLGELVMYYQAFQKGQEFLERMMRNLAMLYEDNLFLSNLYKFLDLKPQVVEPQYPVPVPRPMRSGIVFNHVSFDYPNTSRKTLQNINLSIKTWGSCGSGGRKWIGQNYFD
jgi:ATP-binding cassette subfamily B protein